jgi:hypothetical protein
LLLSQEPIDSPNNGDLSLDEEAVQLMKSTLEEKQRCARILEGLFHLEGTGEEEGREETNEGNAEGGASTRLDDSEGPVAATGATAESKFPAEGDDLAVEAVGEADTDMVVVE